MPVTLALRNLSKEVFKIKAGLGYTERKEKKRKTQNEPTLGDCWLKTMAVKK